LAAARDWVRNFVDRYNVHHLHRGINYVTPDQRHRGDDAEVLARRHEIYQAARRKNPARWSGTTRNWRRPEQVWLNPENEA
ncbi:MAG: IS3 family transposase, partial [Wenzhouxiangellaceae bacterium]